jgi:hypothetical protein
MQIEVQRTIGKHLRLAYDDALMEKLPPHFEDLLRRLDTSLSSTKVESAGAKDDQGSLARHTCRRDCPLGIRRPGIDIA